MGISKKWLDTFNSFENPKLLNESISTAKLRVKSDPNLPPSVLVKLEASLPVVFPNTFRRISIIFYPKWTAVQAHTRGLFFVAASKHILKEPLGQTVKLLLIT